MEIIVRKPTAEEATAMESCPVWEKEVSEFPWHYDEQEQCLVIEGEVTVETADGSVTFGPGDFVTFPQGLDCTWKVTRAIRKHYKFG